MQVGLVMGAGGSVPAVGLSDAAQKGLSMFLCVYHVKSRAVGSVKDGAIVYTTEVELS